MGKPVITASDGSSYKPICHWDMDKNKPTCCRLLEWKKMNIQETIAEEKYQESVTSFIKEFKTDRGELYSQIG